MEKQLARAAIHVGNNKKSFSVAESNEAERRGWDEKRYNLKNAEKEKNNHYDFSRKNLNFEIVNGRKIVPLGSNKVPLVERLQHRWDELGFKPYMDQNHPNRIADNSPNGLVNIIFSGDHDVLSKYAFGNQKVDYKEGADNSQVRLEQGIKDWALDTYDFACRKWGEENIIGFCVHCDETSLHIHVLTVPVEKVKKRGRIGSTYVKNDDPGIRLSTKEWKALSKEDRADYTKTQSTKDFVERVSYAKVWGEHGKDKSQYLEDLHTDYHNEVGYKYGLERGTPYDELSEEEKRSRKHKDKVTLENERQAKARIAEAKKEEQVLKAKNEKLREQKDEIVREARSAQTKRNAAEKALDNFKKYEVLATIDKKEITFPLLNVRKPIEEVLDVIKKELSSPIPTIGQKTWRENRVANIEVAIESFVSAINKEREKQNTMTRDSVNKLYTYYMQNLNKLVKENQLLTSENENLKTENSELKVRISQLDEHAVEQKNAIIRSLEQQIVELKNQNSSLRTTYKKFSTKYNKLANNWNSIWKEPEFNEALKQVQQRKEREKEEKEKARIKLRNEILDSYIADGRNAILTFARGTRIDFGENEAQQIGCGIIASAEKYSFTLSNENGIDASVNKLLSGMSWSGCTLYRQECVCKWTYMFAEQINFDESIIEKFISFIDQEALRGVNDDSTGGSNGSADQLTNWDGTQKTGLGSSNKPKRSM